jgi:acyl carrier protein
MAAHVPDAVQRRWAETGIGQLMPDAALQAMAHTARGNDATLQILVMDRARVLARADSAVRSLFGSAPRAERPMRNAANSRSVVADLRLTNPADQREALRAHVRTQVSAVLGLTADAAPDDGTGLTDLGMDSLMATELRTRLQQSLGVPLPATLAFEHPTISALTSFLMQELGLGQATAVVANRDTLQHVSDDDLAKLLDEELNEAGF